MNIGLVFIRRGGYCSFFFLVVIEIIEFFIRIVK